MITPAFSNASWHHFPTGAATALLIVALYATRSSPDILMLYTRSLQYADHHLCFEIPQ